MGFIADQVDKIRNFFVEDDEEEFETPTRPTAVPTPKAAPSAASATKPSERKTVTPQARPVRTTVPPVGTKTTQKQSFARPASSNFSKTVTEKNMQQQQQATVSNLNRTIAIKEPRAYADIMEAARIVKNGESVLVNFKFMADTQARRSIDFMTGVVFTLDGDIQNVGGQIFLMTPANITVDAAKELSILAGQNFESYDNLY